ncbi:hypothetical protein T492DRAFT_992641 [Pavlovales sp. CCMP2436]|nr:hypothetical protein T492DRAFT_992641 [Pavlovales sp. CCMP2436]|mmetsp:Transcript_35775/g.82862  ORF Transcript_35775/g.82862 Transcript_35775/m.82862 type:complete len:209 (+) Transcript_35775:38-664(+)|eukprot:CAMPEP_0179937238 /NCGR_PEP_ID=MMETSP0983-20121128/14198_1 /TAXON_ID=483367 /ORGANISM="non described non described, Strain CCMP 2436" /LENGTH=208 /DNA_ID=CAMNT_0021842903 /DNA_START=32 /DNA_END=658 /DNA_ORIENTATION=-
MRGALAFALWLSLPASAAVSSALASKSVRQIKSSIVKLARGTQNGLTADVATAAQIVALSRLLEEANPTPNLATSDLVDGKWSLVYTSTSGGSAGKLGPFVGRVEQHFDISNGGYSNFVHLGPAGLDMVTGELKAAWNVLGDSDWRVNFMSISFSLFGLPIVQDKPLNQSGTWRLVFMDDDFRVLWASGGGKQANLYILARNGATFES